MTSAIPGGEPKYIANVVLSGCAQQSPVKAWPPATRWQATWLQKRALVSFFLVFLVAGVL